MSINLFWLNENDAIVADHTPVGTTLARVVNGAECNRVKITGIVDGAVTVGKDILCLVHVRDKDANQQSLILYRFDDVLRVVAKETIKEYNSWYANLVSTISEDSIYTLRSNGSASISVDGGISFDIPSSLIFTKIDLERKITTEWEMETFPDENLNGFVTKINRLYMTKGELMIDCSVFDPDNLAEVDDPDYELPEPGDIDFIEFNSMPEIVKVDFDARKIFRLS